MEAAIAFLLAFDLWILLSELVYVIATVILVVSTFRRLHKSHEERVYELDLECGPPAGEALELEPASGSMLSVVDTSFVYSSFCCSRVAL